MSSSSISGLPGMSGVDGIGELSRRHPQLRLVVLTIYDDDERIFDALCAGAAGYLLKKTPPARLIDCLDEVMSGGAPMSPQVASRVISLFREFSPPSKAEHHLTPHEVRILTPARRRPQLQDRCRRAEEHGQHRGLPHEEHLPEAASALQGRGGRKGAASAHRSLTRSTDRNLPD